MDNIYKFFCVFLFTLFFVSTSIISADVGEPTTFYEQRLYTGTVITTGLSDNRMGLQDSYTFSQNGYVASTSFEILRYGAVTDYVYGFILSSELNLVATSSNWVLGSTLSTSGHATTTFLFDNYEVASGTTVYFGWTRSGSYNASLRYQTWSSTGAGTYYYPSGENPNKTMVQVISGYTYVEPSNTCPEGYECYTIEEMATTTEAIYAVGYSINLYMGIFLGLLFGYMAFIFFKKFIP